MKIALASQDGVSISPHFGRSTCFIIFAVVDGKVSGREIRDNTFTAFAKGDCHGGDTHHHDVPHSHGAVIEALRDCTAVLCYGMGGRAAAELTQKGIRPVVLAEEMSPEEAVAAYLTGAIKTSAPFCRCHE